MHPLTFSVAISALSGDCLLQPAPDIPLSLTDWQHFAASVAHEKGLTPFSAPVLQRRWQVAPMQATAALSVFSMLVVLPPYVAWSGFDRLLALPVPMLILQVAIQGVLAGAVAVLTYTSTVAILGASRATAFPAIVPGTATLIGIPLTGEWPTALQWTGIAVVTFGLLAALNVLPFRR